MNKIKNVSFSLFLFAFVLCFSLNFSTTIANAGVANFTVDKVTDPSTVGTLFDFTIMDTTMPPMEETFMLGDDDPPFETLLDDGAYTLTEDNPSLDGQANNDDFIVESAVCSDQSGVLGPPDVVVTIDNDADPALMVDFSIMGTQEIDCVVTNTSVFFTLEVDADDGDGTGTVTGQGIMCSTNPTSDPADCSEPFPNGEMVELNAIADVGSEFIQYGGECSGTDAMTTVTLDEDRFCTATFNDVDACVDNPCDTNATCTDNPAPAPNDPSGRTCVCDTGYEGDGEPGNCTDIDACINNMCGTNATCTDNPPPAEDNPAGRTCECDPGFEGDPETMCTDIDACVNNPCDMTNGTCTDLPAPAGDDADGRTCGCNEGFALNADGVTCDPIPDDEVDACVNNPCDTNATCTDIIDGPDDETGRTCACDSGFVGDGEPGNCTEVTDDSDDIDIDSEGTTDDGVRVQINVGSGIGGGGTILVDLPPQVKPEDADLVPNIGNCIIVDPDSDTNVVDADIVCDVDDFASEFDLDLELCLEGGDEDAEGIGIAEIEVIADDSQEEFSEFVEILLTALQGCGDGGGCSIASSNTNTASGLSNLLVMLLPAIVGIGGIFIRRRKQGA